MIVKWCTKVCSILSHQGNGNALRCQLTLVRKAIIKKTITNAYQDMKKDKLVHRC